MTILTLQSRISLYLATTKALKSPAIIFPFPSLRQLSSASKPEVQDPIRVSQEKVVENLTSKNPPKSAGAIAHSSERAKNTKSIQELDEELRMKMEGIAGDGGEAGRELEDGQPTAMKRSVRNNMFRYI